MPAIYSFSLDHKFDNDIIIRLESMKNRSSWIRMMLRRELDYERLQLLVGVLYEAYKTQVEMVGMHTGYPRDPKSLYQFREIADRNYATRIDQPVISPDHLEDHNSSQEQE